MRLAVHTAALAALALAAPACVSDINTARSQAGAIIVTYRAPGAAYGAFRTFAMATRVARLQGTAGQPVLLDAPLLLGAVSDGLAAAGLSAAAPVDPANPPAAPAGADLSVNVSVLEPPAPSAAGFWAGSAEQLGPDTWGLPAGTAWSYSWSWVTLDVTAGTILVELADLRGAGAGGGSPVVWAALVQDAGVPGGSYGEAGTLAAVARALARWPLPAGLEAP